MTAIAIQRRDEIIQNLASGLRLSEIAPIIGVCPNALSKVLKSDPDYRAAIETGFHVRLDKAEKDIESAEAMVDVTRAGTKFKALAWRAEREFPETWAGKANVINLQVNVASADNLLTSSMVELLADAAPAQVQHNTDIQAEAEDNS